MNDNDGVDFLNGEDAGRACYKLVGSLNQYSLRIKIIILATSLEVLLTDCANTGLDDKKVIAVISALKDMDTFSMLNQKDRMRN